MGIEKKPLWLLQSPMKVGAEGYQAKDFLGVAFAHPATGGSGEWGPRGDSATESMLRHDNEEDRGQPAANGEHLIPSTASPLWALAWKNVQLIAWYFGLSRPKSRDVPNNTGGPEARTALPTSAPQGNGAEPVSKWPRELNGKVYKVGTEVTAVSAETVLAKIKDDGVGMTLKDMLEMNFGWREENRLTATIPLFKRIPMYQPVQRIRELLENEMYRKEMIRLFEESLDPGAEKKLWIAVQVIVCGSMTKEKLNEKESSADVAGKAPNDYVDVSIHGKRTRVKSTILRGTYEGEVIVGMVYRAITLEKRQASWWNRFLGKDKIKVDIVIERNESGFYISRSDAPGNEALFLGNADQEGSEHEVDPFADLVWISADGPTVE